ncbi:unnamed protein product [Linum trigynum]|uniref:Secreted peptide n=1 Tax=Linum trigynum TaxID=586398 RepID=A0AAV2E5M3_9ROSI
MSCCGLILSAVAAVTLAAIRSSLRHCRCCGSCCDQDLVAAVAVAAAIRISSPPLRWCFRSALAPRV